MKFATIITTRSKSCSVKTLHTILRLNLMCMQTPGTENEVVFVEDDPYAKCEMIQQYMKTHDRIFFIDFCIGVDDSSLSKLFDKHEGLGCLIFPAVVEGIDWEMFKDKVNKNSKEPIDQIGLNFDTVVGNKISDGMHTVLKTSSKCWLLMSKNVSKHIKDKKYGVCKVYPRMEVMFSKFKESGVKIHAYTKAKLVMTYPHECVSNILNATGVKSN